MYQDKYLKEKKETQIKIKEAVYQYEENVTNEIVGSKDKRKLYKNIDKLRNDCKKTKNEIHMYDEEGKKISEHN